MSKKGKSGNNKPKPSIQTKKPTEIQQPTSPEVKEGLTERNRLINEGESKKKELIAQGEKLRQEIESKAKSEVAKEEDKIKKSYIDEVKDKAIEEANKEKEKILKAIEKEKKATEILAHDIDVKNETIEAIRQSLEQKQQQLLEEKTNFEKEKKIYKTEYLASLQDDLDNLRAEKENVESENLQLNKKLSQLEKENKFGEEDRNALEEELRDAQGFRAERIKLQSKIYNLENDNETIRKLYSNSQDELNEAKNTIERYGDDPQQTLHENETLKARIEQLQNRIANYPDDYELLSLRKVNEDYEKIRDENETLHNEKIMLERELIDYKMYKEDCENKDRSIKCKERQLCELQTELDKITDIYNKNFKKVFSSLSEIDEWLINPIYNTTNYNLKEICEYFKYYLATQSQPHLYYDMRHIRTFIAGMAASKILILEGMSGTGKSSMPREFGKFIGCDTSEIPVQSSWKDRNDILGYYNDFEKRYKETEFLKKLYWAIRDKENVHCIMLDEMNLSRIEYYFADFLSVLEKPYQHDWKINLIPDFVRGEMPELLDQHGDLLLTNNIWFIGTANKDDSTFTITDKVYDRAVVLNFREKATEQPIDKRIYPLNISFHEFQSLLTNAIKPSPQEKDKLSNIIDYLDMLLTDFEIGFGNRIKSQIEKFVPAYIKCGGKLEEGVDIIFSTKVLRKIQGYDDKTKTNLDELYKELDKNYPSDFLESKKHITKLKESI
ncbi:MAG: hypothetical protein LBM77_04665 [Spirochaetaceae bacterium]|jgi:hypothetical protein|nr:hypothetical protein [Spirochaetaceae bacterium]